MVCADQPIRDRSGVKAHPPARSVKLSIQPPPPLRRPGPVQLRGAVVVGEQSAGAVDYTGKARASRHGLCKRRPARLELAAQSSLAEKSLQARAMRMHLIVSVLPICAALAATAGASYLMFVLLAPPRRRGTGQVIHRDGTTGPEARAGGFE